jgi:hypothetical protein
MQMFRAIFIKDMPRADRNKGDLAFCGEKKSTLP